MTIRRFRCFVFFQNAAVPYRCQTFKELGRHLANDANLSLVSISAWSQLAWKLFRSTAVDSLAATVVVSPFVNFHYLTRSPAPTFRPGMQYGNVSVAPLIVRRRRRGLYVCRSIVRPYNCPHCNLGLTDFRGTVTSKTVNRRTNLIRASISSESVVEVFSFFSYLLAFGHCRIADRNVFLRQDLLTKQSISFWDKTFTPYVANSFSDGRKISRDY